MERLEETLPLGHRLPEWSSQAHAQQMHERRFQVVPTASTPGDTVDRHQTKYSPAHRGTTRGKRRGLGMQQETSCLIG